MCRHKRLFLLQDWRKEDSGAPDRQQRGGSAGTHADRSAPAPAANPRGLPASSVEAPPGAARTRRARRRRPWVGQKSVFFTAGGGKYGGGCAERASGLKCANQEERRTSPALAVSWRAERRSLGVFVCVWVWVWMRVCWCVSTVLWNDTEEHHQLQRLTGCCRTVFSGLCKHFCAV